MFLTYESALSTPPHSLLSFVPKQLLQSYVTKTLKK